VSEASGYTAVSFGLLARRLQSVDFFKPKASDRLKTREALERE